MPTAWWTSIIRTSMANWFAVFDDFSGLQKRSKSAYQCRNKDRDRMSPATSGTLPNSFSNPGSITHLVAGGVLRSTTGYRLRSRWDHALGCFLPDSFRRVGQFSFASGFRAVSLAPLPSHTKQGPTPERRTLFELSSRRNFSILNDGGGAEALGSQSRPKARRLARALPCNRR